MPVFYDIHEFRPVQGVNLSVEPVTTGDGRRIGQMIRAVVNGTIVPEKILGVYESVPEESRLTKILAEQKKIRQACSTPGKVFQIQGWDGGVPVRFVVQSPPIVQFPDEQWVTSGTYSITFEGPMIAGEETGLEFIKSCGETWNYEEDETTWMTRVSHSVNAQGAVKYDGSGAVLKHAWQNAREFVIDKLKLGWTTVGDPSFSPVSGQTIAATSSSFQSGTLSWNPVRQDSYDETEGTYSCTETFLLSPNGWWEERRSSMRTSDAEPSVLNTVTMSGVVHGLFSVPGDYASKLENAKEGWETIKALLYARTQNIAGGVALSVNPVGELSYDVDEKDGSISYSVAFNDRVLEGDCWDSWTVTRGSSYDDYKTTVAVSGSIRGVFYPTIDTDKSIKLTRAKSQWEVVKGMMIARAIQGSGVTSLKPFALRANVSEDQENGAVNYQFEFDNRVHAGVEDSLSIQSQYSRESGITAVTVSGTVKGLRTTNPDEPFTSAIDREERYDNANLYFSSIRPNLIGLAANYISISNLNPNSINEEIGRDPYNGVINFSQTFNTRKGPTSAGALFENVQISKNNRVQVMAEKGIPGRDAGPLFQKIHTRTAQEYTVSVEVVYPPGEPLAKVPPGVVNPRIWGPDVSDDYISVDSENWSPTENRYSYTMTWRY